MSAKLLAVCYLRLRILRALIAEECLINLLSNILGDKMPRILGLSLFLLCVFAFSANAQGRTFGQIYTDCGLGGMIGSAVGDDTAGRVVAVVSNITWDLGTTASSSNISSPDSCAGNSAKSAAFLFESYDIVVANLAEGDGDHLRTLLKSSGCVESVQTSLIPELRITLSKLVSSAAYATQTRYEKSEQLFDGYSKMLVTSYSNQCSLG